MTSNPLSSISYNTKQFLIDKLEELKKAHIISCYMVIFHLGEDGDKDHAHFRIEPNRRIDPMDIQEMFKELNPFSNVGKPLGVRPFRPSKEEDWFLYAVHDQEYLKLKYNGGDSHEKIPYDWHDIIVPDDYDLEVAWVRAKSSLKHNASNMANRIINGVKPLDLILEGENVHTVNAINQAIKGNDYNRLQDEFEDLQLRYNSLCSVLQDMGFELDFYFNSKYKKYCCSVVNLRSHE